MVKLYDGGAYLVNGTEIVPESEAAKVESLTGKKANKDEAKKGTIAYGIMEAHNTSGDMDNLKIKFDAMASHDITFVGIIQTAKASGMEKFPLPYVLTNCHNSLCAVGGTINEDEPYVWIYPLQRNTAEFMYHHTSQLSISICVKCMLAVER